MSGSMNVGLRMMMSRAAFERTGLMGFGSRGAYRYLFKMSPGVAPGGRSARRAARSFARSADRGFPRIESHHHARPGPLDHFS